MTCLRLFFNWVEISVRSMGTFADVGSLAALRVDSDLHEDLFRLSRKLGLYSLYLMVILLFLIGAYCDCTERAVNSGLFEGHVRVRCLCVGQYAVVVIDLLLLIRLSRHQQFSFVRDWGFLLKVAEPLTGLFVDALDGRDVLFLLCIETLRCPGCHRFNLCLRCYRPQLSLQFLFEVRCKLGDD